MGPGNDLTAGGGPLPGARRTERVDFGPSIRTRARVIVAVAFVIAMPALLIGVFRAGEADDEAVTFLSADRLADSARQLQVAIEATRTAIWRLEAAPTTDHRRATARSLDQLSRSILVVEEALEQGLSEPDLAQQIRGWTTEGNDDRLIIDGDPMQRLRDAIGRVRRAIDPVLSDRVQRKPDIGVLRNVHAALDTSSRHATRIALRARELTEARIDLAVRALNKAGRDQLVLFLLLMFAFPVVAGFGPAWMILPLTRLKGLALRIASGRAREVRAVGSDEVAEVTRGLAKSLARLEEDDRLKTKKIFETRKLLRKVLTQIDEPVLIVGRAGLLDYANTPAAELLGDETHHLEGRALDEICFSPLLKDAVERARTGDTEEAGIECVLETASGRVAKVRAVIGGVQDQQGHVSRVVVVLH